MIEKDDWRLTSYNGDLNDKTFEWKAFQTKGNNDHEHCYFCWRKITDLDVLEECDKKGYMTHDNRQGEIWVCQSCFEDFKTLFQFKYLE